MSEQVVDVRAIDGESLITTQRPPQWWRKVLGANSEKRHYMGDGTTWRHYPDGQQCTAPEESWLCNAWRAWRWKSRK